MLYFFDNLSPGIVVLVNPVSKTEQHFLLLLDLQDEFVNVFLAADAFQHADDCLICASVLGAVEGSR